MKTFLINRLLVVVTSALLLFPVAQSLAGGDPPFRELQSIKLPFTPSTQWYSHTDDFKFFLCSDKSDMLMLDGVTGKILWQRNFEKEYGNKKFSYQFWNKAANVILVFDEDTKKGVAMKYFIDGKTGTLLWSSDKYVSDFGQYELEAGFGRDYDETSNGVLLPTKETVDLVNITTGKTLWSKPVAVSGKPKDFNCFIMTYYDLVKIMTGKDSEILLTISDGKEVTDFDKYFNKKRYLADRMHAKIIDIPEKEMYVLMITESEGGYKAFTGIDLPKLDMTFMAYNARTDQLIWSKKYHINCAFNWVSKMEYFARMYYDGGKLFIEHNPSPKPNTGLTVLNPDNGELAWEASFKASDIKSSGLTKTLLTPYPAPHPLTADGKTYVVNKAKNIVSCYETGNGTKVWDSEDFPDAQKIPSLILTDGVLVMGYGGGAKKCASIVQDKGPNIERYEYNNKDKYGINAYDAATGKIIWNHETIEKKAKVKFDLVAGMVMIDGQLICATDKNFLVIDPKTGNVANNIPVANEKLGESWSLIYFADKGKIILNCEEGIIKIDAAARKIEGSVKTPTFPFFMPYEDESMKADDPYTDYAVFTKGDGAKMVIKEFASVDLDKMTIRGVGDAVVFTYSMPHFSEGGEMFYMVDGDVIKIYSVK